MNLVVSIVIYPFILLGVVAEQSVGLGGIVFTMIIFLFFECCTNPNGDFYLLLQVLLAKEVFAHHGTFGYSGLTLS